MRRPKIRWRVPANSIYRVTNGGTRIEIVKNKLRAKLNAAAKVSAARQNAARPTAVRPSSSRPQPGPGGKKGTPQQRAQLKPGARQEDAIKKMQKQKSEQLFEDLIRKKKLVWARHPDENIDVIVVPETGCMVVDLLRRAKERASRMPFGTRGPNLAKHADLVIEREGQYSYMHLDPNGYVTVGIGHKLGNVDEALALPDIFFFKAGTGRDKDGSPRDKDEAIRVEFEKVRTTILDETIKYGGITDLRIDPVDYDQLMTEDQHVKWLELKGKFPKFSTYPELVQRGMLDLVFNMGTDSFFGQFTKFRRALKIRNWKRVAAESRRSETDDDGEILGGLVIRNNRVQGWFVEAVKANPYFVDPNCKVSISKII